MRNRWGVEIKKGHWVHGKNMKGKPVQGRVMEVNRVGDQWFAGPYVILENGDTVWTDDISQTLGPMTLDADGVVRQNPALRFRDLSIGQRFSFAPSKDGFHRYGRVCVKTSARGYEHADGSGSPMRVGSINVEVVAENPLTRVRIKSPPQRPAGNVDAPSTRLVKRRKKTAKAAPGVYANPGSVKMKHSVIAADRNTNLVFEQRGKGWIQIADFRDFNKAKEYATAYANAHNKRVKIEGNFGK